MKKVTCSECLGEGTCMNCKGFLCPYCKSTGECPKCHGWGMYYILEANEQPKPMQKTHSSAIVSSAKKRE